jgi:hypothetical protein
MVLVPIRGCVIETDMCMWEASGTAAACDTHKHTHTHTNATQRSAYGDMKKEVAPWAERWEVCVCEGVWVGW